MNSLESLPSSSFFKKEHYETFLPSKIERNDQDILIERKNVQLRLLELHDRLYPEIRKKRWNIDKHNSASHLVSGIDVSNPFIANKLSSIWLHYGKTPKEIKEYQRIVTDKNKETFINHLRLQVIISNNADKGFITGFWLVIGKNDGSVWDRDYIKQKTQTDEMFISNFFDLFGTLENNYFIRINNKIKNYNDFSSIVQFKDFVLEDNPSSYFIIGKDYQPNSIEIFEENILNTAVTEFSVLYPIYDLVKHRLT